jgi:hypothetical protein
VGFGFWALHPACSLLSTEILVPEEARLVLCSTLSIWKRPMKFNGLLDDIESSHLFGSCIH